MLKNSPLDNFDPETRDKLTMLDRLTRKLKLMQQIDTISKTLEQSPVSELPQRLAEIKELQNQIKRLGPC